MRRWLFVLLLLAIPLQMVWASAAPYCGHEADGTGKNHFGHHEHQHRAGGPSAPGLDDGAAGAGGDHPDCASCHLGCAVTPPAPTLAIDVLPHDAVQARGGFCYASHVPSGPERPDRSDLTAAARFGGGVAVGSRRCA